MDKPHRALTKIPTVRLGAADAFRIGYNYVMSDIRAGMGAEASFDLATTPANTERGRAFCDGALAAKTMASATTEREIDFARKLATAHDTTLLVLP